MIVVLRKKIAHNFGSGQYFSMKLSECVHNAQYILSIEFWIGEIKPFLPIWRKSAKISKSLN